ncbi:tetratricopeptide repeat protein [Erythrobacter sp.]|uniref:tetratricopeptide repeat protein n=1 Tax=Erythrobacter sp. TaxID=1042 RepID=UPI001425DD73|nr:tetratricopeptide repeat protein [Erythrobacter sp.]QIQ87876.1 MAG: sel1 repeat family protein [Erythrobacter sp.]
MKIKLFAALAAASLGVCGALLGAPEGAAQTEAEPWNALSIDDITTVSTRTLTKRVLEQSSIAELREAAERGDARAAYFLGYAYKRGLGGVEVDLERGYGLAERSCQQGDRRGCVSLAYTLFNGDGVAEDVPRALALFETGCREGIAFACVSLASIHQNGTNGVAKDAARAERFYREGCVGNYGLSCRYAGEGFRTGRAGPQNYEAAHTFFAQGCRLEDSVSCFYAARTLQQSRPRSDASIYPTVREFYATGCEKKVAAACFNLGAIYNEGRNGQARDTVKAVPWMERACDLGYDNGCYNLGSWLIDGRAGRRDVRRAIELLGPLCLRDEDPDIQACNNAGTAAYRGSGLAAPDYDTARIYYEQACYMGALVASCRTLSDMFRDRQIAPAFAGERQWLDAQLCFKAAEGDYCDARTAQHKVYRLARRGSFGEAQIASANLCAAGDGLGCKFQEVLLACKNKPDKRSVCRKIFS